MSRERSSVDLDPAEFASPPQSGRIIVAIPIPDFRGVNLVKLLENVANQLSQPFGSFERFATFHRQQLCQVRIDPIPEAKAICALLSDKLAERETEFRDYV